MEVEAEKDSEHNNNENSNSGSQPLVESADSYGYSQDQRERHAHELKAGLHPLKYKFVFWYTRRTPGVRTQTSYEDNIKKIVEFSTVEGFWVCYCHLARPSALPSPTDLHLFKDGIRPLWEDSANCNGGKWIIRFKKVVSGRFWEDLVRNNKFKNLILCPHFPPIAGLYIIYRAMLFFFCLPQAQAFAKDFYELMMYLQRPMLG